MTTDFTNIEYLKEGTVRQRKAYAELRNLSIFQHLKCYKPLLTGTIPIGIDVPESDLDIICQCSNHTEFSKTVNTLYSSKKNYNIYKGKSHSKDFTIATFDSGDFRIEIFGQDCPTQNQNAYRHMLIEHKILSAMDNKFKTQIIELKKGGLKTEPAFAKLLGLKGDPYEQLLRLKI